MQQEPTLAKYAEGDFEKRPIALRVYNLDQVTQVFRPHRHVWAQVAYTSSGIVMVATEQGRWLVPPGYAVWVPTGKTHGISLGAASKFIIIHIDPDRTREMPQDCCVLNVSPLLRELIATAEQFPREYEPDTPAARLMSVILDQMECAKKAPLLLPMPKDERLQRLVTLFMENPAEDRTLIDLAKHIGTSERNLSRIFKSETGMTFGKWRQQRRLMAAIEQLTEGHSVTKVAFDSGYESVSAFISMFRQVMGVTPSRYFKEIQT